MTKIQLTNPHLNTTIEVHIAQPVIHCAMKAAAHVAPAYIAAFLQCLANNPNPTDYYNPGDRRRCPDQMP